MKVDIEGVQVFFERSKKAKNINISVKSSTQVRVAVPSGVSFNEAEEIARSKSLWIKKSLSKLSNQISLNEKFKSINKGVAKKYLIERLSFLSHLHELKYNKVAIRNQKTRWGSCSENNNINLNIKLVCLPKALIDYVILHELAHTKIKNHSPSFWTFLENYIPAARKADKALKRYSCL